MFTYICPFMSTPDKKVDCTVKCALCVNGSCIIRVNAMLNEDTKNDVEDILRVVKTLR